ncbi:iron complex transport system ATP-binding protein [Sphingobium sp. B1D7B]|uniref:ABC transporter ATP-binding protein n=1 Tax=Sphingobium sp. B1D7B TaxID=2940578 RepID=UPI0022246053|nr:ABC transporter ATP-binding protein [Sphingobium sp. B1D7B]MCW2406852.1 iron complex transport system ATP-binding protein [Sphingobium sp. B1D7B]
MLAIDKLGASAGAKTLLAGIDLVLHPGRLTAIVGPNGAGKSTLLACLAGLRRPDRGHLFLDGAALADLPARERARRIGYLPQDAPLHWNIAVRALVRLGRFPYGDANAPAGRRAIEQAMNRLDLHSLADRLVGSLSGGERARVMLARVLAGEPAWILADEPLAALDIVHRHNLMAHLRNGTAQNVGVVVVLHDLSIAARYCDDALLLSEGKVVASGRAEGVLTPEVLGPVFDVEFGWAPGNDGRAILTHFPR